VFISIIVIIITLDSCKTLQILEDGSLYMDNVGLQHVGNYSCHDQRWPDVSQTHLLQVHGTTCPSRDTVLCDRYTIHYYQQHYDYFASVGRKQLVTRGKYSLESTDPRESEIRAHQVICLFVIPAKARDYGITGVGSSVCLSVCLSVCHRPKTP